MDARTLPVQVTAMHRSLGRPMNEPLDDSNFLPIRGMRDAFPEDLRLRGWLLGGWREVARRWGFDEAEPAPIEDSGLRERLSGHAITANLYRFADRGGEDICLRAGSGPGLVRMVLARGGSEPLPLRWTSLGHCFRQAPLVRGRKHEHFEWALVTAGLTTVAAEAEIISAQLQALREVGLDLTDDNADVQVRISDQRLLSGELLAGGLDESRFDAAWTALANHRQTGIDGSAHDLVKLGLSVEAARRIVDLLSAGGSGSDGLADLEAIFGTDHPAIESLREVHDLCDALGLAHLLRFDLKVIRHQDGSNAIGWEIWDNHGILPKPMAAGGRCDGLAAVFGSDLPVAIGSMGDVALIEILRARSLVPVLHRAVDDVVYPMKTEHFPEAMKVARFLRKLGRTVVVDFSQRRFATVLAQADEVHCAANLYVIGGPESRQGNCTIRPLGPNAAKEYQVTLASLGVARKKAKADTSDRLVAVP